MVLFLASFRFMCTDAVNDKSAHIIFCHFDFIYILGRIPILKMAIKMDKSQANKENSAGNIGLLASYLTPFAKDISIFSPFSHKHLN